ncbi:hypothetical protein J6A31_05800 [bacterium]|nr:hypothetical protein [bacterium]
MTNFENLATTNYDPRKNEQVREELMLANIPVMKLPGCMDTEVRTQYIGLLNGFVFYRAWRYWICEGNMPLEYANQLYTKYEDLLIRAGGHCGNLPPVEMSVNPLYIAALKEYGSTVSYEEYVANHKTAVVDDMTQPRFVRMYHIDTQLGLNRLAQCIIDNDIHTENMLIR